MAAYQPMQNPVANWSWIAEILSKARQESLNRDEHRADSLLKQQSSDRDQARLDEQIRRQQATEERQAGLDTAGAIPKIKDMLTPGHPTYDPESGMSLARAYGINLNAQQPTMPVAPERPAEQPIPQMGARGDVKPPDVTVTGTSLNPQEEARFQQWKQTLPPRLQSDSDYDLRGFYKKNPNWSLSTPDAHMTDEFKLPNHQTFSDESRYFNPDTKHLAGHWNGDAYAPFDPRYKRSVDESEHNPAPPDDGGGVDAISGGPVQPEIKANTDRAAQFDQSMNDYRGRAAAASRMAPTYHGTSRIGPVSFDPNAAVATREERLRQQREQVAPLAGAANEQFRPVVQAMVAAGMPGSEIAKFIAEQQKELHGDERKAQYSVTAEEQMRHNRATEANGRLAAGDRGRAQNERSTEKLDETVVRDDKGQPIGYVPTGKGGAQGFATRDADYSRGEQMLTGLLDDLEKNGNRAMSPEAIRRRSTLYNNAVIGVATVSPLGKTDEAQKLERESIGPSGAPDMHDKTGVFMGANPEAVRRKLEELRGQRARYRAQTLIPLDRRPGTGAVPAGQGSPDRAAPEKRKPKSNPIIDARSRPSLDDLAAEHGL